MQRSKLFLLISGAAAILLSLGLFILSLQPGWQGKADSAIVFLTLAATFRHLDLLLPGRVALEVLVICPGQPVSGDGPGLPDECHHRRLGRLGLRLDVLRLRSGGRPGAGQSISAGTCQS